MRALLLFAFVGLVACDGASAVAPDDAAADASVAADAGDAADAGATDAADEADADRIAALEALAYICKPFATGVYGLKNTYTPTVPICGLTGAVF